MLGGCLGFFMKGNATSTVVQTNITPRYFKTSPTCSYSNTGCKRRVQESHTTSSFIIIQMHKKTSKLFQKSLVFLYMDVILHCLKWWKKDTEFFYSNIKLNYCKVTLQYQDSFHAHFCILNYCLGFLKQREWVLFFFKGVYLQRDKEVRSEWAHKTRKIFLCPRLRLSAPNLLFSVQLPTGP